MVKPWSDGVKPWVNSPELTRGSSPARPGTAEGGRNSSSGDQMAGGGQLRGAGGVAHPLVAANGAGVARSDGKYDDGGGRSSGNRGDGAIGHGREHSWVFRVRRSAVSMLVMLGRAAELTSAELVDHGGGEPRWRWGS